MSLVGQWDTVEAIHLATHPTRYRMLFCLKKHPFNSEGFCQEFGISELTSIRFHLRQLVTAKLVKKVKRGKLRVYSLASLGWDIVRTIEELDIARASIRTRKKLVFNKPQTLVI